MCVCACVCMWHHFFVNTYLIKQYRYPLSTHFCIYPFESPNRFHGIRWELIYKIGQKVLGSFINQFPLDTIKSIR